jgi:hypothetical protein
MASRIPFLLALSLFFAPECALSQFPSPPFGELIVPAAASAHGAAGTYFHTDLWVINLSASWPIPLHLAYLCRSGCSTLPALPATPTYSFALAPGEARLFEDVIASVFSAPESSGALDVYAPSFGAGIQVPFFATSRTYSIDASSQGSYGTAIPALSWSQATTHSKFVGLASNGGDLATGFRSNAGAFVYSGGGAITYRLMDSTGHLLGTPLTVEAQLVQQVNDIFQAVGAGGATLRDAVLEITTDNPALPYVTVIDNRTGDSVFLPGVSVPLPN